MSLVGGKIGYAYGTDGPGEATLRLDKLYNLSTVNGRGWYAEPTSRGMVFSLSLTAWTTTTSAGNLINAAAAAVTQFALWNPIGSGKNLELLKFGVSMISGTLGIPPLWHSIMVGVPTIASQGTAYSNLAGPAAATVARWMSLAAGTALTGGSALTTLRMADLAYSAGTYAALSTVKAIELIDGDIILPPGTGWVPTWSAAGTTTLGAYSITWMEVPIAQ